MRGLTPSIVSVLAGGALVILAGVGFAALGVLAVALVWTSLLGAGVRREPPHEQVVEGQPFRALIALRCGPLGLPGAELHDPLAGGSIELAVPPAPLRGRRAATVRVQASLGTRGLHR